MNKYSLKNDYSFFIALAILAIALISCSKNNNKPEPNTNFAAMQVIIDSSIVALEATFSYDQDALGFTGARSLNSQALLSTYDAGGNVNAGMIARSEVTGELIELSFTVKQQGVEAKLESLTAIDNKGKKTPLSTDGVVWKTGLSESTVANYNAETQASQLQPLAISARPKLEAAFADYSLGDFDQNGTMAVADALGVLQTSTGELTNPSDYQLYHSDVDCSSEVNVFDALKVLVKSINPNSPAVIVVCPQEVRLNVSETETLLVGNLGSLELPEVTVSNTLSEDLIEVKDTSSPNAIGKALEVLAKEPFGRGVITFTTNAGASNVDVFFSGVLTGDDTAPAAEAIPEIEFTARAEDYSEDHPNLEGMPISFNTFMLSFEFDTTVSEANTILKEIDAEIVGGLPGIEGKSKGTLILRIPSNSHEEMTQVIESLESNSKVSVVVQDILISTDLVTQPSTGTSATNSCAVRRLPNEGKWTWSSTPGEGNWGLEIMRVPQVWNLNAAILKNDSNTSTSTSIKTGILDEGFAEEHPDLKYSSLFSKNKNEGPHGTHTAGIIGATYNNGLGVDGVNPFANLFAVEVKSLFPEHTILSFGETMLFGSITFLRVIPFENRIKVLNISLGYNWSERGINPDLTTGSEEDKEKSIFARTIANKQGQMFVDSQTFSTPQLPVIVVSAGNDGGRDAKYNSPWTNAALVHGAKNIIVVESVAYSPVSLSAATRSGFSNIGGHVSAPGSNILSTFYSPERGYIYETCSGTSMAAPHVTGLVGFLYSIDPDLPLPTNNSNPILDLLREHGKPVGGGAEHLVDAFDTVMDLDSIQDSQQVLSMLLDIDDGTPDGNKRTNDEGLPLVPVSEDVDNDGGIGDGEIDMSDFRRWRDWLLQLENSGDLSLDGGRLHPKKDVNGDGLIEGPEKEGIYPRGDFNGDGQLSRTAKSHVPGAINSEVTDLKVLQARFKDPNYETHLLDSLLESGDIEINAENCLLPTPFSVYSSMINASNSTRRHTNLKVREIYTLKSSQNHTAEVRVFANEDELSISSVQKDFSIELGSDYYWKPVCDFLFIEMEEVNIRQGEMTKLRFRAGIVQDNITTYLEGIQLSLGVQGGSLADIEGATNSEGYFETLLRARLVDEIVLEVDASLERQDGDEIKRSSSSQTFEITPRGAITVSPVTISKSAEVSKGIDGQFTIYNRSGGDGIMYTVTTRDVPENVITSIRDTSSVPGNLIRNEDVTIKISARCPPIVGNYKELIELIFKDSQGNILTDIPTEVTFNLICTEKDQPGAGTKAFSEGDPHLQTSDGFNYDFQAVGDYILSKSSDLSDDFEIQVRYRKPVPSDRWCCGKFSFNEAVAMVVHGDIVELYAEDTGMEAYVNGTQVTSSQPLAGGGSLHLDANAATVNWTDGSYVRVGYTSSLFRLVDVYFSGHRRNLIKGLLGNFDGDSSNEIQLANGTVISNPAIGDYYLQYRKDWHVKSANSLFSRGRDPFDLSYPPPNSLISKDKIKEDDPEGYAEAESICIAKGIVTPAILCNCIVDVAITGDPFWADVALGLDPNIPRVNITSEYAFVLPQGEKRFTGFVNALPNGDVNWSVTGGSFVRETGTSMIYTAPATQGNYEIVVTSIADPSLSSTINVEVGDARQVSWDSGGDGTSWSDPLNWSNDTVPAEGDVVVIDLPNEDITIIFDVSGPLQPLRLSSITSAENFTLAQNTLLILNESSSFDATLLILGSAILAGDGDITINGHMDSTVGGTIQGTGKLIINGTADLSGRGLSGRTIENHNKITLKGNLETTQTDSLGEYNDIPPRFINNSGATFEFQGAHYFGARFRNPATSGQPTFINRGTISKTTGTGFAEFDVDFENTGTIEVQEGGFELHDDVGSPSTLSGDLVIAANSQIALLGNIILSGVTSSGNGELGLGRPGNGARTITVDNADANLNTPFRLYAGTLSGTGIVNANAPVIWDQAVLQDLSRLNINGGMIIAVPDGRRGALFDSHLVNNSTVTWQSGTIYTANQTGSFTNSSGAVFEVQAGDTFGNPSNSNEDFTFTNSGIIRKVSNSQNATFKLCFVNSGGSIEDIANELIIDSQCP